MTIYINARFTGISADELSKVKRTIESLGFDIDDIKTNGTNIDGTIHLFAINSTLSIEVVE